MHYGLLSDEAALLHTRPHYADVETCEYNLNPD